MLFNNIETCVLNCGFSSGYFSRRNGVRQGYCTSPLLFVLAVELMAIMVRQNREIKGVMVGKKECTISQFADDTTCIANSVHPVGAIYKTLDVFSMFPGLHLNLDKSSILSIGKPSLTSSMPWEAMIHQRAKVLGIWVSRNRSEQELYTWNFSAVLEKMWKTCSYWSNRTLSLKGRVTVFNLLIYLLVQYVNANTVTPKEHFHRYERLQPGSCGWVERLKWLTIPFYKW